MQTTTRTSNRQSTVFWLLFGRERYLGAERENEHKEVEEMTQAELAGGMANAPQAHPEKGQLIRDFTLTSTLGQPISLSDYRGRSNLVLIFVGDGDNSPNLKMLTEITADHDRFLDEQTQV